MYSERTETVSNMEYQLHFTCVSIRNIVRIKIIKYFAAFLMSSVRPCSSIEKISIPQAEFVINNYYHLNNKKIQHFIRNKV